MAGKSEATNSSASHPFSSAIRSPVHATFATVWPVASKIGSKKSRSLKSWKGRKAREPDEIR